MTSDCQRCVDFLMSVSAMRMSSLEIQLGERALWDLTKPLWYLGNDQSARAIRSALSRKFASPEHLTVPDMPAARADRRVILFPCRTSRSCRFRARKRVHKVLARRRHFARRAEWSDPFGSTSE